MAVSTNTLHGNGKVTGPVQAVGAFNKFQTDATPKYTVGYRVRDIEGNEYVYAHFGAAINTGLVASQDISESTKVDTDNAILAPASCNTTTDCSAGQNYIEMTLASTTAGQYAGGKFIITGGAGEGYTYDIIDNTVTGDPASGTVRFELKQPLEISLTATSDACIIGGRYTNLEPCTGTTDAIAAGVTCASYTADQYGWLQTKGVVGIYNTGGTTVGSEIAVSSLNASTLWGYVKTKAGHTTPALGWAVDQGDNGGVAACYINI